jgi:hypothetical protein
MIRGKAGGKRKRGGAPGDFGDADAVGELSVEQQLQAAAEAGAMAPGAEQPSMEDYLGDDSYDPTVGIAQGGVPRVKKKGSSPGRRPHAVMIPTLSQSAMVGADGALIDLGAGDPAVRACAVAAAGEWRITAWGVRFAEPRAG